MKVGTFDVESDGLLDTATTVHCGVVRDHDGERRSFRPHQIDDMLVYLDTFDVLIGHNCIDFDFPLLRKLKHWEFGGKVVDTLIMSRVQRPNRRLPAKLKGKGVGPHSVAAWGLRLGRDKVEHEEWDRFSEEMMHRCEQDVDIQVDIYNELLREGKGEGWGRCHRLNMELFTYLQRQGEFGWAVDQEHLERCMATLHRWIDRIDRAVTPHLPLMVEPLETKKDGEFNFVRKPFLKSGQLNRHVCKYLEEAYDVRDSHDLIGGPFSRCRTRRLDIASNKEVKEFLLSLGWVPKEWNTNNAGDKTSPKLSHEDPFVGIEGGLGKLIVKRVQCRARLSILEGWKELIREDGRIQTGHSGLAVTGRLRHKGVVNVPSPEHGSFFARQMRGVFVASRAWTMVGVDSEGNQVRQLVARMGDESFRQAVLTGDKAKGTDHHSVVQRAAELDTRGKAKNLFYAVIFGAGDWKVGKVVGSNAERGKALKATLFQNLPNLKQLIDRLTSEWRGTAKQWFNKRFNRMEYSDGYITGLDGRPIQVSSEHKVLVSTLQSDEAIHMALAYVMFHRRMAGRGYRVGKDFRVLIWYHDEWQTECRTEQIAREAGQLGSECIHDAAIELGIDCPHEGSWNIGKSWAETH